MRFLRSCTAAVAILLAIGMTAAAPSARADTTGTGAVTVMLLTTSGAKLELPNVVVTLSTFGGAQYYETLLTTAHGRATFSGVPTGSTYTAYVTQRGDQGAWTRLSAYKVVPAVTAGHHVWVALTMRLAASISGRVVDATGSPVSGTVEAYGLTNGQTERASTDSDGRYSLVGLPSDSYRLRFSGAGIDPKVFRGSLPVVAQYGTAQPSRLTGVDTVVTRTP
jgi:hypothetical protein